jgi:hypothetical protein
VISDYDLSRGETGVDLARWMDETGHLVPGAIFSGHLDGVIAGAEGLTWRVFQKPVPFSTLVSLLHKVTAPAVM